MHSLSTKIICKYFVFHFSIMILDFSIKQNAINQQNNLMNLESDFIFNKTERLKGKSSKGAPENAELLGAAPHPDSSEIQYDKNNRSYKTLPYSRDTRHTPLRAANAKASDRKVGATGQLRLASSAQRQHQMQHGASLDLVVGGGFVVVPDGDWETI